MNCVKNVQANEIMRVVVPVPFNIMPQPFAVRNELLKIEEHISINCKVPKLSFLPFVFCISCNAVETQPTTSDLKMSR